MDKLKELLSEFTPSQITAKPNYINIKCSLLTPNNENAVKFNTILGYLKEINAKKVNRTPSGGISVSKFVRLPSYDYTYGNSGAELLILTEFGFYRIQFRASLAKNDQNEKQMSGRKAFMEFSKILSENGIKIEDYAVKNGKEIKKEIEKPLIKLEKEHFARNENSEPFENCHHIDFHNSYPGGLAITHPEFRPVIEKLYNKRQENSVYKAILNYTIGFMQSKWVGYKYANLSRDAINNNNERVRRIAQLLKESGRVVLAYNTDGVWYSGEIFHGEGEGENVGEWKNDHTNCLLRFKSAGAYEYIEKGEYHPVLRGYTNLDKIKSRDYWEWGDIYKTEVFKFMLDENGIMIGEKK